MRDDPGRLVADAEDPALAFGHDLELHRGLVEAGMAPLELAQRGPLRLADRLPGRLGREVREISLISGSCASSCAAPGAAAARPTEPASAAATSGLAPFPLEPSSFGGVRELRRSGAGAGVFATSRRVISPCPTVQRFVVTQ